MVLAIACRRSLRSVFLVLMRIFETLGSRLYRDTSFMRSTGASRWGAKLWAKPGHRLADRLVEDRMPVGVVVDVGESHIRQLRPRRKRYRIHRLTGRGACLTGTRRSRLGRV